MDMVIKLSKRSRVNTSTNTDSTVLLLFELFCTNIQTPSANKGGELH